MNLAPRHTNTEHRGLVKTEKVFYLSGKVTNHIIAFLATSDLILHDGKSKGAEVLKWKTIQQ